MTEYALGLQLARVAARISALKTAEQRGRAMQVAGEAVGADLSWLEPQGVLICEPPAELVRRIVDKDGDVWFRLPETPGKPTQWRCEIGGSVCGFDEIRENFGPLEVMS